MGNETIDKLKNHGRRIRVLEKALFRIIPIRCICCKRVFHVFREDFYKFKRQKLNIYCPFTRKIALNWRDYHEKNKTRI